MTYHNPVLLQEAVEGLALRDNGVYVDVTFGGGGHSTYLLSKLNGGKLIAFDQDQDAWPNVLHDERFSLVKKNFRYLKDSLEELDAVPVDGILADLGVSSHQFDDAARGFSIRFDDTALDMRMNADQGLTAADILNQYSAEELNRVFREYGELYNARRITNAVMRARETAPIVTAKQLKDTLAFCAAPGKENSFYAQVFQALRIEVNDEMAVLREFLEQAPQVLRQGGRLVVISYHSLEDRMVKSLLQTGNTSGELHKDFYGNVTGLLFRPLTRKPVEPSQEEKNTNPRSRSAKMRIAEKL